MNEINNPLIYPDDPFDAGLPVDGPSFKQEQFLRRQRLWSDDLTRQDASWLIEERLKEFEAKKKCLA